MPRPKSQLALDQEASVKSLLELFEGPLRDVAFPGVDGRILAVLSAQVTQATNAVEAASTALAEAHATLEQHKRELAAKAQVAVAYARVFAADNPPLLSQIESAAGPDPLRPNTRTPKRKAPISAAPPAPVESAPVESAPIDATAGPEAPLVEASVAHVDAPPGEAAHPPKERSLRKRADRTASVELAPVD